MALPETRYAKCGNANVAFQELGEGPPDLLFVGDWGTHVEGQWEEPRLARFLGRLAEMGRLVTFDQRGTGVSDPLPLGTPPTLEEAKDDALTVLDAVRSTRATVVGVGSGGPVSCLLAASHPDRVSALVLVNAFARLARAPDHPWGIPPAAQNAVLREVEDGWGKGGGAEIFAPTLADDPDFRSWFARYRRLGASPKRAVEGMRVMFETDVRHILGGIAAPTLVVHRVGDLHARVGHGRDMAERITNARYLELPGPDHLPWVGDSESILQAIGEFLGADHAAVNPDRVLVTVVFTDIVESTRRAAEVGDQRWRRVLDDHDEVVRRQIQRYQGRAVKATGDGFFAAFDGPSRAIHCASAIREAAGALALEIRAGVHTGECEARGDDLGGIAVHIGARLGSLAAPGEVLVSGTVRDLVAGSGFIFIDRGSHELKGVPGVWRLWAVEG